MMNSLRILKYRLTHWLFRWTVDVDGDLTFTVAGCLNFTKYKEHTVVSIGIGWAPAPRHVKRHLPTFESGGAWITRNAA